MWECCQCLNVKTGNSDCCEVCGHSKCSACFEITIPDVISNENEQLYYFELKKISNDDMSHSHIEYAHLKTFQEKFNISTTRAKKIVQIAEVKVNSKGLYVDDNSTPWLMPSDKTIAKTASKRKELKETTKLEIKDEKTYKPKIYLKKKLILLALLPLIEIPLLFAAIKVQDDESKSFLWALIIIAGLLFIIGFLWLHVEKEKSKYSS